MAFAYLRIEVTSWMLDVNKESVRWAGCKPNLRRVKQDVCIRVGTFDANLCIHHFCQMVLDIQTKLSVAPASQRCEWREARLTRKFDIYSECSACCRTGLSALRIEREDPCMERIANSSACTIEENPMKLGWVSAAPAQRRRVRGGPPHMLTRLVHHMSNPLRQGRFVDISTGVVRRR